MTRAFATVTAVLVLGACASATRSSHAPEPIVATSLPPITTTTTTRPPKPVDRLCAFRGFGTWVDEYDTESAFQDPPRSAPPPVTPNDIAAMKARGVHTLYIQLAKDDVRAPGVITNPTHAAEFLTRAHAAGLKVVAWFLPTHVDPAVDSAHALALVHFRAHGQRFDGIALDIEGVDEHDVMLRNERLVALVRQLDAAAGAMPIGGIVYPPVATDVLNPALWPDFPWKQLAPHIDVWLPMSYYTYRSHSSPYRDAYLYTLENIQRLRADVGNAHAAVHAIGGVQDTATSSDDVAFVKAARAGDAIGASTYDYNTTEPSAWPLLRVPNPVC